MSLPTDNPFNSLLSANLASSPYSPANAGPFGSGLSTPFGSGLSGPFGSLAPSSNVNALSSWLAKPATPPHLWFYVIRRHQTILGNIKITDAQRGRRKETCRCAGFAEPPLL